MHRIDIAVHSVGTWNNFQHHKNHRCDRFSEKSIAMNLLRWVVFLLLVLISLLLIYCTNHVVKKSWQPIDNRKQFHRIFCCRPRSQLFSSTEFKSFEWDINTRMMRMTEMVFYCQFFPRPATCIWVLCGWNCAPNRVQGVRIARFP